MAIRYVTIDNGDGVKSKHKLVIRRGWDGYVVRCTVSCSGCCDLGENCGSERLYPFDKKAGCRVGSGCDECGYTGKRRVDVWTPLEVAAFDRHFDKTWKRLERLKAYYRRKAA